MDMPELKITMAKVDELVPYAGNAKLHPFEQIEQIANSIEEFGNNDPIAVWHNADGEMEIVEGHGRLLALKKLGIEECPVICLDHLTDEQRRAYVHIHNKLNMNSGFDIGILSSEIEQLDSFDWGEFGFDDFDLAEIATAVNDFSPRSEEIDLYSQKGEEELKSYNVVICCLDEQEQEWLMSLLQEENRLKRLYMCSELMERIGA